MDINNQLYKLWMNTVVEYNILTVKRSYAYDCWVESFTFQTPKQSFCDRFQWIYKNWSFTLKKWPPPFKETPLCTRCFLHPPERARVNPGVYGGGRGGRATPGETRARKAWGRNGRGGILTPMPRRAFRSYFPSERLLGLRQNHLLYIYMYNVYI